MKCFIDQAKLENSSSISMNLKMWLQLPIRYCLVFHFRLLHKLVRLLHYMHIRLLRFRAFFFFFKSPTFSRSKTVFRAWTSYDSSIDTSSNTCNRNGHMRIPSPCRNCKSRVSSKSASVERSFRTIYTCTDHRLLNCHAWFSCAIPSMPCTC